jgi:CoA:oxalate CoA-transferase
MSDGRAARPPLAGTVVVEVGQVYNGPYAGLLLCDAGATVYKVEPPTGDALRDREGGTDRFFAMLNTGKLGATLNLKHERGVELLHEMARRADVMIENFRPGVMERLGVAPESLLESNPRLVYASSSGYGRTSPNRLRGALDLAIQAHSGMMSLTGYPEWPPLRAGAAIADFLAGTHLYGAITTALYERERTHRGQIVEIAMSDVLVPALATAFANYYADRTPPTRSGNRHGAIAPYDAYEAADGYIVILCGNDEQWHRLTTAMGREGLAADGRFSTDRLRVEHSDELDELIGRWTRDRPREEIREILEAHAVTCAPVREITEVLSDEEYVQRGTLLEIDHPVLGDIRVPGSPLHFGGMPATPSPNLGEHNEAVYVDWLGLAASELDELEREGVV